jgi:hypothetical protein
MVIILRLRSAASLLQSPEMFLSVPSRACEKPSVSYG